MRDVEEKARIILALHGWLESQGIPRMEWGPLLAAAAGNEVNELGVSGNSNELAVELLSLTVRLWAMPRQELKKEAENSSR